MRVAIVGTPCPTPAIREAVTGLVGSLPSGTIVLGGGMPGVDELAYAFARAAGMHVRRHHVDDSKGIEAIRLYFQVLVFDCDELHVFPLALGGQKPGTKHVATLIAELLAKKVTAHP